MQAILQQFAPRARRPMPGRRIAVAGCAAALLGSPLAQADPLQLNLRPNDMAALLARVNASSPLANSLIVVSSPERRLDAAALLTELLNVDGIRVVAATDRWNEPDMLALRHAFRTSVRVKPFVAIGVTRAVYRDSSVLVPSLARISPVRRSVGAMAESGIDWEPVQRLHLGAEAHWIDMNGRAAVLRAGSGYIPAEPMSFSISLRWLSR